MNMGPVVCSTQTFEALLDLLQNVRDAGDQVVARLSAGVDVSTVLEELQRRHALFDQFMSISTEAGVTDAPSAERLATDRHPAAYDTWCTAVAAVVDQNSILQDALSPVLERVKLNLDTVQLSVVLRDKYSKKRPPANYGILLDQHT